MLVYSIQILRQFSPAVSGNIEFLDIQPCIITAEAQLAQHITGPALLAELDDAIINNNLTPAQASLLPHLQRYIATAAILHFIPKAEVNITSSGIFRMETDNGKTAYQQQIIRLSRELQNDLDLHTESILQFLDTNAAQYPTYTSSTAFSQNRSLFVQNGIQFAATYFTTTPFRVYQRLRPILSDIEQLQILKILGDTFFTELKQKLALPTPSLTQPEKRLIQIIQKYTVYTAIARGIAQQMLAWDDRGLTTFSAEGRSDLSDDAKRSTITPSHINQFIAETQKTADDWLQELSFFLQSTASTLVFQSWYNWQQSIAATNTTPVCENHTHTHTFSM